MERLTRAESDIATLKDNYTDLKEDYNSLKQSAASCFEGAMAMSNKDDDMVSELDDIKVQLNPNAKIIQPVYLDSLNMMSLDMMSRNLKRRQLDVASDITSLETAIAAN